MELFEKYLVIEEKVKVGDKVTNQPKKWFDGTLVKNWPDPQFLGIVKSLENIRGISYARVKWDKGRLSLENLSNLIIVK